MDWSSEETRMKIIGAIRSLFYGAIMTTALGAAGAAQQPTANHWAIVLHGGAGIIERASMNPTTEAAYRASLAQATQAGAQVLDRGGSSLDAVEAAIRILEDDPLFNAGRGADFAADGKNELDAAIMDGSNMKAGAGGDITRTRHPFRSEDDPLFNAGRGADFAADGKNELDAAIMDGSNMKAGAVGDITRTRHPISLARAVMEKSQHVFLVGQGADEFSVFAGLEQVDPSYFFTERRWQSLVKQLKTEGLPIPPRPAGAPPPPPVPVAEIEPPDAHKYGTLGVVALDRAGNLAAGTSTGGTQAKRWGRVGDSPIIGAGTYASNQSCAVSATGTGEY